MLVVCFDWFKSEMLRDTKSGCKRFSSWVVDPDQLDDHFTGAPGRFRLCFVRPCSSIDRAVSAWRASAVGLARE